MADVSVELHTLEEELSSFIKEITSEFKLSTSATQFPPFNIREIHPDNLQKTISDTKTDSIILTTTPPTLPAETYLKFIDKNPGAMTITLGRLTPNGLKESWLSARTFDPAILDTWKRVARKLRSRTKAGATAINPETGASSRVRTHRYTEGAMRLQEQGVVMLPQAGGAVFRLGG